MMQIKLANSEDPDQTASLGDSQCAVAGHGPAYQRGADQRLCFLFIDSAIPLLHKSESSGLYSLASSVVVPAWFVSDLVRKTL